MLAALDFGGSGSPGGGSSVSVVEAGIVYAGALVAEGAVRRLPAEAAGWRDSQGDIRCPSEARVVKRSRSQEEQRMQDHATRLVGLEGFVVNEVEGTGERLDLHVELLARATGCESFLPRAAKPWRNWSRAEHADILESKVGRTCSAPARSSAGPARWSRSCLPATPMTR
jgi:hypothetical protein